MESDSFEQEEVAQVLNKHFIAIKVDREERPDLDSFYMNAVIAMSGHGGWPMSVFLTPDKKPFFGGTFFWKQQFIALLTRIAELWERDKSQFEDSADQLLSHLKRLDDSPTATELSEKLLVTATNVFQSRFDRDYGGFGGAPKFPPSMAVQFLLRVHRRTEEERPLQMAERTLEMMARGGIYDHLAGGFSRYSTDERWLVPHFEKMLYDNALLTKAYLEAYQVSARKSFFDVAEESLDFILTSMSAPEGGYYSAWDAGPVGNEGEYYVWSYRELKELLTAAELEQAEQTFAVSEQGNFEGNNVLHLPQYIPWEKRSSAEVQAIRKKLFEARSKRQAPHLDDKILTDWNGLMIAAMAKGYRVLGERRYLDSAATTAKFIQETLFTGSILNRRFRDGEAAIAGFLTDYAMLIHGLIELYQASFDERWILFALELQKLQDSFFWDAKEYGYFLSQESAHGFAREKEFYDGALPAGNSVALLNLIQLNSYSPNSKRNQKIEQLQQAFSGRVAMQPAAYPYFLSALDYKLSGPRELVFAGPAEEVMRESLTELNRLFCPNTVFAFADSSLPLCRNKQPMNGKPTYYLCEQQTCNNPSTDIDDVKQQLSQVKQFELYGRFP